MDLGLRNKAAVVTGGAVGLGAAIARRLAAEGAAVAVNFRRHAGEAEALAAQLHEQFAVPAMAVGADVADEVQVQQMFGRVLDRFGRLDVLVNNAAVCPTCPAVEMTVAQWNETLAVNLTGTFLCSREALRHWMAAGRPGRIVNISSTAALLGSTTGHAPYDASKGGMISLTISLAREAAPHGIAVNALAPGMMVTDMTAKTLEADREKYLARIPLRRIADAAEVADVAVFLASDRASYMTGATVNVSGGLLMR